MQLKMKKYASFKRESYFFRWRLEGREGTEIRGGAAGADELDAAVRSSSQRPSFSSPPAVYTERWHESARPTTISWPLSKQTESSTMTMSELSFDR